MIDQISKVINALAAHDCTPRRGGCDDWTAICPAHDGQHMSLDITAGSDGRVVMKCCIGCEVDRVLKLIGLAPRDLSAPSPNGKVKSVESETSRLSTIRLSEVKSESVRWLWPYRVPLGKLTIKAGMQGLGKSFVTLEMASLITTGRCWPDLPDEKIDSGSVVLLNLEDGLGDTIRPRLDRMGADTNRIVAVEGVQEVDHSGRRTFNIERDIDLLEREVEQLGDVRMVVVDPLTAYIGGGVDANRDNEVRAALHPLVELAKRHDLAVVGVMHLRKAPSDQAMFKVLGSTAFTALPRVVWLIGQDHDNPDQRLMLSAKMNIGKAAPGMRFEIVDPGRIEWLGTTEVTAEEAFRAAPDSPDETGHKVVEAMDWLDGLLAAGPQRAKDIKRQAGENCIAPMTLRRAKERLGVVSFNSGTVGSAWFWGRAGCEEPA